MAETIQDLKPTSIDPSKIEEKLDPSSSSFELFGALHALDLLREAPPLWWPNAGSFEVVLGAILTQNSKWEKVAVSIKNLQAAHLEHLGAWQDVDGTQVRACIKPSGLYETKTRYLAGLTRAMIETFGSFEHFTQEVSRSWLLEQKGVGFETADAILCYACLRPVMVVDSYTAKLLKSFGFTFENYHEIQSYLTQGITQHRAKVWELYGEEVEDSTIFAHFHGMIVEYCKR